MTDEPTDTPEAVDPPAPAEPHVPKTLASSRLDKLPVQMLNDRILVDLETDGERRSTGGILIPATAQIGKRLRRMGFDLEPDGKAGFGRPDGGHFGAGIAGYHAAPVSPSRSFAQAWRCGR